MQKDDDDDDSPKHHVHHNHLRDLRIAVDFFTSLRTLGSSLSQLLTSEFERSGSTGSYCKISIDIGRRLLLACWKLEGFVTLI
jgi:hypothetical protein